MVYGAYHFMYCQQLNNHEFSRCFFTTVNKIWKFTLKFPSHCIFFSLRKTLYIGVYIHLEMSGLDYTQYSKISWPGFNPSMTKLLVYKVSLVLWPGTPIYINQFNKSEFTQMIMILNSLNFHNLSDN